MFGIIGISRFEFTGHVRIKGILVYRGSGLEGCVSLYTDLIKNK